MRYCYCKRKLDFRLVVYAVIFMLCSMKVKSTCRKYKIHIRQPHDQPKPKTEKQHRCQLIENTKKTYRIKNKHKPGLSTQVTCVTDPSKAVLQYFP